MLVENLLGALLRIKEVIRRRVESGEEDEADERGMTRRLEDILRESSGESRPPTYASATFGFAQRRVSPGPLVAGRTKDFVQRILAASAGGPNQRREAHQGGDEAAG